MPAALSRRAFSALAASGAMGIAQSQERPRIYFYIKAQALYRQRR